MTLIYCSLFIELDGIQCIVVSMMKLKKNIPKTFKTNFVGYNIFEL